MLNEIRYYMRKSEENLKWKHCILSKIEWDNHIIGTW